MPRSGRVTVPVVLMLGAVAYVGPAFLPGPSTHSQYLRAGAVAAPAAAVLGVAPAAFADQLHDAAAKFSEATYPLAEKINWVNQPQIAKYIAEVSASNPEGTAQAMARLLEVGLQMDATAVHDAVAAHSKAIKSALNNPNLMTTKEDFAAVNEATARMIASAYNPYKFFSLLKIFPGNGQLQQEFYAGNDQQQAQAAWESFRALTQAVAAAHSQYGIPAKYAPQTGGQIGDAAKAVADATYDIAAKVDWGNTPAISKFISSVATKNPKEVAQAMDKVLEVGLSMDPKAVQVATQAHYDGLRHVLPDPAWPKIAAVYNKNFMVNKADWEAIMEQTARMIGTADAAKFKSILTAFPGNAELQQALFETYTKGTGKEQAAFQAFEALTKAVASSAR